MSRITFFMSNHPISVFSEITNPFELVIRECCFSTVDNWFFRDAVRSCWLFYWDPDPGAALLYDGKRIPLHPDRVILIPPYTKFSTESSGTFRQFYLHFSAPPPFDRVRRKIYSFPASAVGEQVKNLQTNLEKDRKLFLFQRYLFNTLAAIPESDFLEPEHPLMSPGIRRAVDWIDQHRGEPLSNSLLCKKAGMSRNLFYEQFKKELGMTPGRYLLNLRLEYARRQLIATDDTIDAIAAASGYADRFHFSKAFKNFYGTPPGAYRRPAKQKTVPAV